MPHGGTHEDDVETRNDVMVFEDEYGPEATKTLRGYTKFAAFRTRRSRWGFVYLMKAQSEACDASSDGAAAELKEGSASLAREAADLLRESGLLWERGC